MGVRMEEEIYHLENCFFGSHKLNKENGKLVIQEDVLRPKCTLFVFELFCEVYSLYIRVYH